MGRMEEEGAQQGEVCVSGLDRLRLRLSAMINSPKAQADRRATIWRLDRDTDREWSQVLEELAETDGLEMTTNDDGTVLLEWEAEMDEEQPDEAEAPADLVVQRLLEAPAPF
ncbi:DUF1654 domain-containing protein [Pseudomonas nitroreducens]|uniref:DUF1654 domain-containing protein n=1 Tax=Pseudomonas nitroreducens TaxID=46680 RepID=UPI002D7FA35C|nr:DUF1654 domain-containing protein [Pseudomonas nitroreducens]